MIIGTFNQQGEVYAGSLFGVALNVPFVTFSPVAAKIGNGPDFVVTGARHDDEPASEIGAAWRKTSRKGKAYLSVKLDSPTLASPINGALTQQQSGTYALVWNRSETDKGEGSEAA